MVLGIRNRQAAKCDRRKGAQGRWWEFQILSRHTLAVQSTAGMAVRKRNSEVNSKDISEKNSSDFKIQYLERKAVCSLWNYISEKKNKINKRSVRMLML